MLVARSPVRAGVPGRGFAADTALWAERANAPLRGVGGDPLSRPVLAKPGFVDSSGESAQDVWAGGSGVEPKGQPAPAQVTLLCRSSERGASIEPSAFAQTAVIQEDEGRESVASAAQTNGIFGLLRVESPKLQQSAAFLAGLLFVRACQLRA